ncbi:MAG: primary-amine oxidase [Chloroflexi bacterium]|nr:primary-amine oxidase [Chloroflexota bacterium]
MATEHGVHAAHGSAAIANHAHPLDPLSAPEVERAAALCRQRHPSEQLRFVTIALEEPAKAAVAAFRAGGPIERRAAVVAIDRADGRVFEGRVDLAAGAVEAWTHRPGVQPYPILEEFADADRVIRADARWQAALRRRGVTDLDRVQIDPWPAGNFGDPAEEGRRILRGIAYARDADDANGYARPIEGVVAVVDLNAREVIRVVDEGAAPVPAADARYDAAAQPRLRDDLRPLEIAQPEGPSFVIEGHRVRWQRWRMRVSLHPREGLVLHEVAYEDRGRVRPIAHRMGLSEMVVPYGDPSPGQYFKNAFDSGELGLGRSTNALTRGCDCLGEIAYLDGVVAGGDGAARVLPNAICIHEEDFNILWKHTRAAGQTEVRRSRRLVVSSWATVGNYDYGFYWYFYEDASIECEVRLTGIIQPMAVGDGPIPPTAHRVARNVAGPIHQHFFCMRVDADVDGGGNTVYEVDTHPLPPGPDNPHHNAFAPALTPIRSEAESARTVNAATGRHWRIVNPSRLNAVGEPVAYALLPGETVAMMAGEEAAVARRATFARRQLWVTQHAPDELYPAGTYPSMSKGGDGLPAFTAANRPLEDRDIVLWYVIGVNHIVRPEDFPITSVHRAGFALKPWGFFDANPALDVAPPAAACDCPPGECVHGHDGHEGHAHGAAR